MSEDTVIHCENLKFSYTGSEEYAVNGVNFSVKRGEFLSVIGHNGSGKSTLARLLNGLLEPESGTVTVLGKDLSEGKNAVEVRKHVGVVFQNPDNQMVASIVEDDVAFGPENIGVEREEIGRRIDWALKAVGMEKYRKATPSRLSGGQKQRIAVAGVLAVKPEILVLDESTAMLDPRGRREVVEVVKRLNKEEGMTIILITHFMDEALIADRTIVMNKGEIALCGTPEEIFENGEMLETLNLSLPRISVLANRLRSCGMEIGNVLRTEELAEQIVANMYKRGIYEGQSTDIKVKNRNFGGGWGINIENLSYTYSAKSPFAAKALKNINLEIAEGEFFGIIGHTGSGKSTLLNLIGGLDVPTDGEIIIDQKKLSTLSDDELTIFRRRKIGFIFQQYNLIPMLTVWENIILPLKLDGKNIDKPYLDELTTVLGLKERLHHSPNELSGGQQQRVAIARALAIKPALILADEPTGNLDSKTSQDVCGLLKITSERFCQTILLITHNEEIAQLAERIIRIEDGRIVEEKTKRQVNQLA